MASRINAKIKNNLFDLLGKRISDAINEGIISPAEAGQMILSSNIKNLDIGPSDERQYISNLVKGSNISGF